MTSARRPRVAVVGPLPPPRNGMTIVTRALLASLLQEEFELVHVDTSDHRAIGAVGRLDLENVRLAFVHLLAFVRVLLRRPALCYVPIAPSRLGFLRDALLLAAAKVARRRVVVHLHGSGFSEFFRSESRSMRVVIRLALSGRIDAVVLGERSRHEFDGLVLPSRVHLVPNGIPDSGVTASGVTASGVGGRRRMVLHLGTLMREKGVFEFLEAARRAAAALPDVHFVLAGPWYRDDEREQAVSFVAEHGLSGRLELLGPVTGRTKASLLGEAALLCLPSRNEGQPLVVLEALCSATPVIATRVGCIPETVREGVEGFLVEPGDVEALAARMVELLADAELQARIAAAARRRYEDAFTLERFAKGLGEVWRAAIAKEGRRPLGRVTATGKGAVP